MYTATLENGKAEIKADSNVDHQVEIQVGGEHNQEVKKIKQTITSYNKKDNTGSQDSTGGDRSGSDGDKTSDTSGDNTGGATGDNSGSTGNASSGNTNSSVISEGSSNSDNSGLANVIKSNEFSQYLGTNSSDYYQKYDSLSGNDEIANGDQSSAKSSSSSDSPSDDGSSEEGKSYELVSPNKIAKTIQNSSGVIILAVIALLILFVVGYKRKNKM